MICRCEKPFIYDLFDQLKDIYEKYPDLETTKVLNKDEQRTRNDTRNGSVECGRDYSLEEVS